MLGTLVEVGARVAPGGRSPALALEAARRALVRAEQALSAFLPSSDVGRFNAAPAGAAVPVTAATGEVLAVAAALARASGGLFDVTLGTGPGAWSIDEAGPEPRLHKRTAAVRLDLGGIGKGYAVDLAFEALLAELGGVEAGAACWVNAGGDLRVTGLGMPVHLRDELGGGARPWLVLREGALATSRYAPGARSSLAGASPGLVRHVSVAAPSCLLSDALTKVVALTGQLDHPLIALHHATAWLHPEPTSP